MSAFSLSVVSFRASSVLVPSFREGSESGSSSASLSDRASAMCGCCAESFRPGVSVPLCKANLSRLPQRRLDADVACGRPAEAGHAADVACGRAGVRTWRAAARAGAQAVEVSLMYSDPLLLSQWVLPSISSCDFCSAAVGARFTKMLD